MRYAIRVEETRGRTVIVEADCVERAIERVESAIDDEELLLDDIEDFCDRKVELSDIFKGGIVPSEMDVSYYEFYNADVRIEN